MPKKIKRKRLVHLLVDECPHCGYTETMCGLEFEAGEKPVTYDENKVTCTKCNPKKKKRSIKENKK